MATSNNRDVKMTLSVETLGTEEVDRLRSEIEKLGKEGSDAAPQFRQLADEVSKLGEQAETLSAFQRLSDVTDQLSQKQAQSASRVDELTTKLAAARAATQQAADAQTQAQTAYDGAQKRLTEINGELAQLRASYDAAGKKTDEYKNAVTTLIAEKTQLQKSTVDLRNERNAANKAVGEAERAESSLEKQLTRSTTVLDKQNAKLAEARQEQERAAAAVEQFGLSSTNVAQSQAQLVAALNNTGDAARNLKTGVEAAANAERELAQQAELARQRLEDRNRFAQQTYERDQQIAAQRLAEIQRVAAAEKLASDQAIAAKRAEQAEFDRLFEIQRQTQQRLELQARQTLAAENQARREAADLAVRIEQEKRQAIEASARAQADAINNAFQTIGQRGAAQLREEIARVRAAMDTLSTQAGLTGAELRSAMQAGQAQINELEREIRELNGTLTLTDRAAMAFKNSMGQIAVGNIIADAVGYLVEKVKELGREFIAVSLQADTMRRALNAIYKDAGVAASQMDFLRNTATVAGVSISNITNDFVKFSAATRASNIPLETTNEVFRATTMAAASLGLGADKTSLALNALGQIASKGVVSMEELRQQLGDSIPGALSLTAKGLGITDAELIKLVESGQLASRDFFPAFAKGLATLQGETDGLRNTWERFKNTLTIATQAGEANGTLTLLTGAVKVLGGAVGALVLGLSVLAEGLFAAGKAAIVFFESLRGNGREAMAWFNEETQKAVDRLAAQADAFNFMLNPTEELRQKLEANAAAQAKLSGEAAKTVPALQTSTESIKANAEAAKASEAGVLASAAAQRIAGDTALEAGSKWVQLNSKMVELAAQQEQNVAVSEKARAGAELEAQAIERIAALRGDEKTKLEAAATAANLNADALNRVALARQNEAAVLAVQLNEMVKLAVAQDGSTLKRQAEIVEIEKKLLLLQEEASKAANAAEAARIEAAQREISIQTYKDNSAAIEQLAAAYTAASNAYALAQAEEAKGLASKEQVRQAEIDLAKAAALYNDALKDRIAALQTAAAQEKVAFDTKLSAIQLLMAEKQAELEVARAKGDSARVSELQTEIKKLEIQQTLLNAEAKRAESRSLLAQAEATRSSLIASNQWTKAAEASYQASVAKARALENEAKIAEITAKKLEELANITNKAGSAARNASGDYDRLAGSLDKVAQSATAAASATASSSASEGDGGGRVTFTASALATLRNRKAAGTLSADDLQTAKAQYEAAFANANIPLGVAGPVYYQGAQAVLRESKALYEEVKQMAGGAAPGSDALGATSERQTAGTTVNINLNGSRRQIRVAGPSDASTLESLLRELESSSGRSV